MRRQHLPCFLLAFSFLLVTSGAWARDPITVRPQSVGLCPERLERITANVQKLIDEERLAGAVTLVARKGKIAYLKAAGWQDKESQIEMKDDTIFRLASMTKPVTCVAVLILYEEGHFRLDDPVWRFIPEFKDMKVLVTGEDGADKIVPAERPVTIYHLLTHTAGLSYQWNAKVGQQYVDLGITHGLIQDPDTIGDSIRALAQVPLVHQPGDRRTYGLSIDVLGYLVEVVSGKTLNEFFRQRIFEPLEMNDTKFFLDEADVPRLAVLYRMGDNGKIVRESDGELKGPGAFRYTTTFPYQGPQHYYSGGGGLCSTAGDYRKFCQMLLNDGRFGRHRILSRKSVELMTARHVTSSGTDPQQKVFGFGVEVSSAPGRNHELGSGGAYNKSGLFYTWSYIDPREELVAITMAQLCPAIGVSWGQRFSTLVYQAIDD